MNYPEHDHIVKFEDCFIDQFKSFYLVLEFCEGGSLDKRIENQIKSKTRFSNDLILKWSQEMILGINFLHSRNIIHRDIKPAYVLKNLCSIFILISISVLF